MKSKLVSLTSVCFGITLSVSLTIARGTVIFIGSTGSNLTKISDMFCGLITNTGFLIIINVIYLVDIKSISI